MTELKQKAQQQQQQQNYSNKNRTIEWKKSYKLTSWIVVIIDIVLHTSFIINFKKLPL